MWHGIFRLFWRVQNNCIGSGVIVCLEILEGRLELGQLEKDGARI